jgi:biotin carboxylase
MSKIKNILLCDANFCVLPILKTIKSKGCSVSVVSSKLDDPTHALADESIAINYADLKLLLKHISETHYDSIVPGCNDRAYMSLAYVAEKLHFKGFDPYETVLTIHHKDRFRTFAERQNYPIPKAINHLDQIELLKFPVLIKPVDSFSGKGINKAYTVKEFRAHWIEAKNFSPSGLVIAEEFIEGKLYSHSAFIKNKKIVVDFFVNEYCTVYPYQVNSSNIATLLSDKVQKGLRKWTEQFANDLNLCDGLVHTQFISDNETFYLVEIARRCPGDLYSQLIQKSTGINYAELYSLPFLGIELPDSVSADKTKFYSRHTVSVDKECVFISASLNLNSPCIQNVQLKYSGEQMKAAPFDKSGIYFIEHKSVEEMEKLTKQLKDFVIIETLQIENSSRKTNEL